MNETLEAIRFMQNVTLPTAQNTIELGRWVNELDAKLKLSNETYIELSESFSDMSHDTAKLIALSFNKNQIDKNLAISTFNKCAEILKLNSSLTNQSLMAISVANLANAFHQSLRANNMSIDAEQHSTELAWLTLRAAYRSIENQESKINLPANALIEMLAVHSDGLINESFVLNNNRKSKIDSRMLMQEFTTEFYVSGESGKRYPHVFADNFIHHSEIWLDDFWESTYNEPLQAEYSDQIYFMFYKFIEKNPKLLLEVIPDNISSDSSTIESEAAFFIAHLDQNNPLDKRDDLKTYLKVEIAAWSNIWRTFDADHFGVVIGRYCGAFLSVMFRFESMFIPQKKATAQKSTSKDNKNNSRTTEKLKKMRKSSKAQNTSDRQIQIPLIEEA